MAITIKPYQQLGFTPLRDCRCPSNYCQPIEATDNIILQGSVTPIGSNMVVNGDFSVGTGWVLGAGFTISGGKLHGVNVSVGNIAASTSMSLIVGKTYIIQAKFDVISQGSAGAGDGFKIFINGDYLYWPDDIFDNGYNQSITATWIYVASAFVNNQIVIGTSNDTIDFDVDYVRVYDVSEVGIAIYDNTGTLIDNEDVLSGPNVVNYLVLDYATGDYVAPALLNQHLISVSFTNIPDAALLTRIFIDNLASITDHRGCITIGFYDPIDSDPDPIPQLTSHCIDLENEHLCTLLFRGTNNDNAFGFLFVFGYAMLLRVYGKIRPLGYPEENETFVFSDASRRLMYARTEKEYNTIIGDAAEHIHDSLRIIRLLDTFTIDAANYVASSDYALTGRKTSDNLTATFSIKDKQGLAANYSCS